MERARLDRRRARRLAVARAGLLSPEKTGLRRRGKGSGRRARRAAYDVLRRFGYLQLDTVSVAGARSHALVLLSRIEGFDPSLAEELLQPDEPVFEYWGHEASWLPMELYPAMGWRREEFRVHPWWGPLLDEHPRLADEILRRVGDEGPVATRKLTSADDRAAAWWGHGETKKVLAALWSSGDLMISERRSFERVYDLPERILPEDPPPDLPRDEAIRTLLLRALAGHGWAERRTLAETFRLKKMWQEIDDALAALEEEGRALPCDLVEDDGTRREGWIRPEDLELADELHRARPRRDRGVLLSPFDPLLWDRDRVERLFGFEQVLEIYKPADERRWGYYCLPILAGEHLVGRVDLKAHSADGRLEVRALHYERLREHQGPTAEDRRAARSALERLAGSLGLACPALEDDPGLRRS